MARVSVSLAGLMWLWWWGAMAETEYFRYKDPKQPVAVRLRDLLSRMTLEEKIGQMVQIDRSVANVLTMRTYSIGSTYTSASQLFVCLFWYGKKCAYIYKFVINSIYIAAISTLK